MKTHIEKPKVATLLVLLLLWTQSSCVDKNVVSHRNNRITLEKQDKGSHHPYPNKNIIRTVSKNTKILTVFTSRGCGCTGSGGAPQTFTTNEQVVDALKQACNGVDFIVWEGALNAAYDEVQINKDRYDGILIFGNIDRDYRLAFTGLPTIVVYNLFEFMNFPYALFTTGTFPDDAILKGGIDYNDTKILTAQLDRRNLCDPSLSEKMFNDLVYKIKLIQVIQDLKKTRILMLTSGINDIIASVNYRGDFNQSFPQDHNERYARNVKDIFGIEIVRVAAEEFYELFRTMNIRKAEDIAEGWIHGARWVEASRPEIIKAARAYLAIDALREKYNCNAVSTHLRSVTGSGKLEDRFNPGIGLELGFKTRGIQAVCQNYPDILISQVLAYLLTGRPSMLGDVIYDIDNSLEIILHCGIPINPYGDERRIPYTIRTHAESPVRDKPEEPGSSTGLTAEWPVGEPVTFWEIHSLNKTIRLHTGEVVNGHTIYTGGEDLDNVMCTAKLIAMLNAKKVRDQHMPYLYGIHTNATLGDLRQQIKD
ncbi:MAG: hypothetical protein JXM79_18945, partial [Sedimentisphaerales bacterium]|nr:hypothetical protein [Sedimentisphaerales bacterium]